MLKKIAFLFVMVYPSVLFAQNVGVGTSSPTEKLHVSGNVRADTVKTASLRLSGGSPAAGKVLTSDATGNATWQTPAGGGGTLTDAYNFGGPGAGRIVNASTATLRVDGGYGLQVFGALGTNFVDNPGFGSRLFFNTGKAVFRAGYLNNLYPNLWNEDSVGILSIAMGSNSNGYGNYSIAMGNNSLARQENAVAIGAFNRSDARSAVTLGESNNATNITSIAMGNLNRAAGRSSAAIGQDNFAEGFSSFAGGARNNTKGISSIALGEEDKALGNYSVAVGRLNISGDVNTFTAGLGNSANAPNSSAIGEGLITNAFGGLTIGRFNDTLYARQTSVTASTALFTVGNGFNSGGGRNTAFTIWNSGWAGVNTGVPNSTLSVNGSLSLTPVFINSALSTGLDVNSSVYFLNGTGSFAPPAANTCTGRIYIIVNQTSAVKNFNGSSYINFSGASVTSIPANSGIKIISDGTSWRLIP